MNDFSERFTDYVSIFNSFVDAEISESKYEGRNSSGSSAMLEAMAYSLLNGGKRIRPVLALEFCNACGGRVEDVLHFALAVEMVHTYSLIHDDLPCMDNDDIRRGKPSNHIAFGYANALLAGDGLLTLAFEKIADSHLSAEKKIEAVSVISKAAGFCGMIAGQVMDLDNENKTVPLDVVRHTDNLKTGEMIKAACLMGCIAAGADDEMKKAALTYAENIGLAFQIIDDILDVTSDVETLGKPIGSDNENDKSTYVSLLGIDNAKSLAESLTDEATQALKIFGKKGGFLKDLALNLLNRKN